MPTNIVPMSTKSLQHCRIQRASRYSRQPWAAEHSSTLLIGNLADRRSVRGSPRLSPDFGAGGGGGAGSKKSPRGRRSPQGSDLGRICLSGPDAGAGADSGIPNRCGRARPDRLRTPETPEPDGADSPKHRSRGRSNLRPGEWGAFYSGFGPQVAEFRSVAILAQAAVRPEHLQGPAGAPLDRAGKDATEEVDMLHDRKVIEMFGLDASHKGKLQK